jgi:hypothetical protein
MSNDYFSRLALARQEQTALQTGLTISRPQPAWTVPAINFAAILCAVCAMAAILTGALVTDKRAAFTPVHAVLGVALTVGGALFALSKRTDIRWLGGIVCVTGAGECLLRGAAPALHAFIAPVVFAVSVALILVTSASWKPSSGAGLSGRSPVILLAPVLVSLQIGLGAAYRHKVMGVLPHMAGAMLIAGFLLIVCIRTMQRAEQRAARTAAAVLLSIVLLQVSLGIATFLMQLLDAENQPAFTIVSVIHICVGSLTLAAAVALALQSPGTGASIPVR